jgi:hypothetical protein
LLVVELCDLSIELVPRLGGGPAHSMRRVVVMRAAGRLLLVADDASTTTGP